MAVQKKWTVFFLIKSVDDSFDELIDMINEIRSFEAGSKISIVLCIHLIEENIPAVVSGDKTQIIQHPSTNFCTIFCRLVPDTTGSEYAMRMDVFARQKDFDITNPRHVRNFFKQKVLARHKAKRYILVTWDHGRAYGIFPGKSRISTEPAILTMDELNKAIRWTFGREKIDLVIMVNCFMQFADAGYALKNSVKYLVAPEADFAYDGYNYPFIFRLLTSDPAIETKELASAIVSSFPTKVYPDRAAGLQFKNLTALFAADLHQYAFLAQLINRLADELIRQLPDEKDKVRAARDRSYIDESRNLVDFYLFVQNLLDLELLKNNALLASLLLSLRKLIVFEEFIGRSFFRADNTTAANGFTIFFPKALSPGDDPDAEFAQFFTTSFALETRWMKLVEACV